ncbi:MAG: hypothetical protein IJW21_07555 [Clostridia bacterium]|nr:hypothetical protein [Clostridia bacterium]
MKKILAIFFIVAITGVLFACGGNKNKNTTARTTATSYMTQNTTAYTPQSTLPTTSTHRETNGTSASVSTDNSIMPGTSAPITGTAPGGSTSVR